MKKAGRPDPFAYVPFDKRQLNQKKRHRPVKKLSQVLSLSLLLLALPCLRFSTPQKRQEERNDAIGPSRLQETHFVPPHPPPSSLRPLLFCKVSLLPCL